MVDLDRIIRLASKSRKIFLGSKQTLNLARSGRATLIILASNSSNPHRSEIEYTSRLSGIPLYIYNGTNSDLGLTCGTRFSVSALAIRETDDSQFQKILKLPDSKME